MEGAARGRARGDWLLGLHSQEAGKGESWCLALRGGATHAQGECSHINLAFLETSLPHSQGCFHGDFKFGLVGSEDIKVREP